MDFSVFVLHYKKRTDQSQSGIFFLYLFLFNDFDFEKTVDSFMFQRSPKRKGKGTKEDSLKYYFSLCLHFFLYIKQRRFLYGFEIHHETLNKSGILKKL